ncbi:lactonase family protein [Halomicroarcula limicola]|uniref:Lactonase family protein n=1 Tax=Haloarcula limicola TaxID=1429915 RepID=A0A8J8C546_9EURY|nr:lactonase family protein [Halomicroarcula limicola]
MAAIGTYSAATSTGVHTVAVDPDTGALTQLDSVVAGPNPTFVASHPHDEYVYAAVRTEPEGLIKAFQVDNDTGELSLVSSIESGALSPCHCSVDATGEYLFVAHYEGGSVSMLPLGSDGTVAAPTAVVEHSGDSIDPDRQTSPHPHSANPGPANDYLYVPDLGTDQVIVYEIRPAEDDITVHRTVDVAPGSGPRHLSFGPDGEYGYLINELDSTVTVFERAPDGDLSEQSKISTLPADFEGENKTAEVEVHPSGRYVFASNRGRDTIVTFAVAGDELRHIGEIPTGGAWPRHFSVSPTGEFLFVENRDTNGIVVFDIDIETGELTRIDERLAVTEPVCLQWV